jgi:putative ABC transport system permease protein
MTQDLWYGLRQLRRSPGFALTAVATLALGIGATSAIFSVVNAVLLKPVGIPDADRLVVLMTDNGKGEVHWWASPTRFIHWRNETSVLQNVSAFRPVLINYKGGEVAEQWRSLEASAETFRCLGIPVLQGRTFTPEEDLPTGDRVAVISRDLWMRRFASDPGILGKTISAQTWRICFWRVRQAAGAKSRFVWPRARAAEESFASSSPKACCFLSLEARWGCCWVMREFERC